MALSTNDETKIREYLLGQLNEEEQQRIEERLMLEDDLFEELEISKGELIEDYRSGDLTKPERTWFEQHFLASAEGKQKYSFAVALSGLKYPTPNQQGLPPVEQVGPIVKSHSWTTGRIVNIVVLLIVGIAIIVIQPWKSPTTFATLKLPISSPARGEDSGPPGPPVVRMDGKDELRISLVLPGSATPGTGYRAELFDSRVTNPIKVTSYNSGEVKVVIPSEQLSRGQYVVKLFAIKADGQEQRITGSYSFKVE